MRKSTLCIIIGSALSLPVLSDDYVIRVDLGDKTFSSWELVNETHTTWVNDGGTYNCTPDSSFPVGKIDGDTYLHPYDCKQDQTRIATLTYEDAFSGKTYEAKEHQEQTVSETESKDVDVTATTQISAPYNCSTWVNSSTQNSNITLLDQERNCSENHDSLIEHYHKGDLIHTDRTSVVEPMIDIQSIARDNLSCYSLLQEDSRLSSGTYSLDSGTYICDMETQGGGWTLMMNQNISNGYFNSGNALSLRKDSPSSSSYNYSALNALGSFKRDNKYTFMIEWPSSSKTAKNIWSQTTNPTINQPVGGYQPISIGSSGNYWGGLERRCELYCGESYMDGSVGHSNWFYAIASYNPWSDGIPAYGSPGVNRTRLWVK